MLQTIKNVLAIVFVLLFITLSIVMVAAAINLAEM
jgi:hypothetical protein